MCVCEGEETGGTNTDAGNQSQVCLNVIKHIDRKETLAWGRKRK